MDPDKFNDLIAPLQRHQQWQEAKKIADLLKEKEAEHNTAQCPYCGGKILTGYVKCKNCASDLIWVDGIPGKPGEENYLRQKVQKMQREAARLAAEEAEEAEARKMPKMNTKAYWIHHLYFAIILIVITLVIVGFIYLIH